MATAQRASELRTMLPCPLCGRTLFPAASDSALTFHCKSGHELTFGELLRAQSAALSAGLGLLLAEWTRQHQALIDTVEDARERGYWKVAEIFDRNAKHLESRISKARAALSESGSYSVVNGSDALHSA
jgi:hypothetical protein